MASAWDIEESDTASNADCWNFEEEDGRSESPQVDSAPQPVPKRAKLDGPTCVANLLRPQTVPEPPVLEGTEWWAPVVWKMLEHSRAKLPLQQSQPFTHEDPMVGTYGVGFIFQAAITSYNCLSAVLMDSVSIVRGF